MFKACTAQQMRSVDRIAIDNYQIPGIVLMENAALACIEKLKEKFDIKNTSFFVLCGRGNNGGDGLAVARHLYNAGAKVEIVLVAGSEFTGDAKINYDIAEGMDIPMCELYHIDSLAHKVSESDVIIDAILGTGISGGVRDDVADVIETINANAKYVLSVDVPSGINSDTGEVLTVAVKADDTVTFGAYKLGMFLYPAADYTGEITVAAISIPQAVVDSQNIKVNVTDKAFVKNAISERNNNSHKTNYGKLLIIAGSEGMSGAAYLSAQAALRSGAGIITVACPRCINQTLESKTTEVMTYPLDDKDGCIAYSAIDKLLTKVQEADAVLIGPGLGRCDEVTDIVQSVLQTSTAPVIVDADAIYAVSQNIDIIKNCNCDLIFTPHTMELSRLTRLSVNYIEGDRVGVSRRFSDDTGAVLLLKGHHTVVTSPSLTQYINITGNPGMATAGSGDVLAGIIAAFAAKGTEPTISAAAGAYIHGFAGDIAQERLGMEAMSATDIVDNISHAYFRILQVDKTNILC